MSWNFSKALSGILVLSTLISGCATINIYRSPAIITAGEPPSGPNQWYLRVGLSEDGSVDDQFHFVVWLHVPVDWQLPWARQYSFSGDFQNTTLEKDSAAQAWMEAGGNCGGYGGPAASGYKWRAWRGSQESLPAGRHTANYVNLRGGLGVPAGAAAGTMYDVKVVAGSYYDSDADDIPDTYMCSSGAQNLLIVEAP